MSTFQKMDVENILADVNLSLAKSRLEELQVMLSEKVNWLIQHDFHSLVQLIYRVDIPEKKLKQLLADNKGQDAAALISKLLIERQLEKLKTRQQFRQQETDNDEERW